MYIYMYTYYQIKQLKLSENTFSNIIHTGCSVSRWNRQAEYTLLHLYKYCSYMLL